MANDATLTETTALATVEQGSPLPVFSGAMMTKALMAYRELQKALDESMPDQIMELEGRPFRKKGYWRAVAVAFNLSVEPIDESRDASGVFADGRENFGWRVTYRASASSGRNATGDGSCYAVEKARRFRCPHPESEGSERTLHFPHENCPDFDPGFQWRAQPLQATEHNIRSHAHTRAFNRAVSNLVGFGEVSAEEVDRGDHAGGEVEAARVSVRADGMALIVSVAESKGVNQKSKKAWVRYHVTCDDGRSGSTFEEGLAAEARAAMAAKRLVLPVFAQDGKYTNLTGLEEPPPAPEPDAEPVGQPEKILTVREAKTGAGDPYFIIQSDRRAYVTNIADVAALAREIREKDARAIVAFKLVRGAKETHRIVTEFGEATVTPPAGPVAAESIAW